MRNLSVLDVDENRAKIFGKYCGHGPNSSLVVEVSEYGKKSDGSDKPINCYLKDLNNVADWIINADNDNHEFELTFMSWESCNAFIEALEFAVSVLKEAKARAEYKGERAL